MKYIFALFSFVLLINVFFGKTRTLILFRIWFHTISDGFFCCEFHMRWFSLHCIYSAALLCSAVFSSSIALLFCLVLCCSTALFHSALACALLYCSVHKYYSTPQCSCFCSVLCCSALLLCSTVSCLCTILLFCTAVSCLCSALLLCT